MPVFIRQSIWWLTRKASYFPRLARINVSNVNFVKEVVQ